MFAPHMGAWSTVTLTTDFGSEGAYVFELKAALMRAAASAQIIDVTHSIPPQDVASGSFVLDRVIGMAPGHNVHVAVVDPGVGSSRRGLIVLVNEQLVVCPDNGLITWAKRRYPGDFKAYEITWRPKWSSRTFHGRDWFAPVAGMLAEERVPITDIAREISDPILLPLDFAPAPLTEGAIIYVDHFGNAVTNVREELTAPSPHLRVQHAGRDLGPVRQTYADVPEGQPLALIGSSGLLEIAVRNGSAARQLGLRIGDPVRFLP
jgi:S-adenosylmethionine hydrolase